VLNNTKHLVILLHCCVQPARCSARSLTCHQHAQSKCAPPSLKPVYYGEHLKHLSSTLEAGPVSFHARPLCTGEIAFGMASEWRVQSRCSWTNLKLGGADLCKLQPVHLLGAGNLLRSVFVPSANKRGVSSTSCRAAVSDILAETMPCLYWILLCLSPEASAYQATEGRVCCACAARPCLLLTSLAELQARSKPASRLTVTRARIELTYLLVVFTALVMLLCTTCIQNRDATLWTTGKSAWLQRRRYPAS
jgi:hypothetical protein